MRIARRSMRLLQRHRLRRPLRPSPSGSPPRSGPPSNAFSRTGGEPLVAKVLRPIGHEDRLSIVDHLSELRSRLIVCLAAFLVAFGVCFWQNGPLIHLLNRALPHISAVSGQHGLAALPNQQARERAG